jgi:hypothetical protein
MEVKIKYEDIIKRCEQLSSFEEDGKFDANGESRYLELHINKVDELLIQQYIVQARAILEERMDRMIENIEAIESALKNDAPTAIIAYPFDFISTVIPNDEIDWLDDKYPVAYFTDGDAFAYYNQVNINAYDVMYIDADNSIYGSRGGINNIYSCRRDGKLYTWDKVGEGLVEHLLEIGFTWTIRPNTRWNGIKTFTKHVNEAIVSYAMAQWFKGKLDDRVPFYEALFNNTLAMAVKNIFTKQAP